MQSNVDQDPRSVLTLPLVRALGQVFQVLGLFFQHEIKACRDCKVAEILKSQVMVLLTKKHAVQSHGEL